MNNPERHPNKPSQKFLDTLRAMSEERDVTFAYPSTVAEAKKQFQALKKIPRTSRRDQRREDRAVRAAVASAGDAARIRGHELGGYGSTAHYR